MQGLRQIEQALSGFRFQAIAVEGDGNCLFRSLGLLIGSDHVELRQEVNDFMCENTEALQS